MDSQTHWVRVLEAATRGPGEPAGRAGLVDRVLELGASLTPDSVGCSITAAGPNGYYTPASSNELALALDGAQYDADDGPCVAACRDARPHSVSIMVEEAKYEGFTAVALAHGVRSSLSLPIPGAEDASALNLYAGTASAFDPPQTRAIAQLLVRCVAPLLGAATDGAVTGDGPSGVQTAQDRARRIARAEDVLVAENGMDRRRAFHAMTHRSRDERCSIYTVAADINGDDAGDPGGS